MSPEADRIFRDAAGLDVELSISSSGDRIQYRGYITGDLKQRIVAHRAEVIAALRLRDEPLLAAAVEKVAAVFPGARVVKVGPVGLPPLEASKGSADKETASGGLNPGSKVTAAVTTLPPLGDGEAFAIALAFRDGSVERYRGSGVAPRGDGRNQTSGRAGKEAPKRRGVETRSLLLPFGEELRRANVPAAEERQRDDEDEPGEGVPAVLRSLGEREKGG